MFTMHLSPHKNSACMDSKETIERVSRYCSKKEFNLYLSLSKKIEKLREVDYSNAYHAIALLNRFCAQKLAFANKSAHRLPR